MEKSKETRRRYLQTGVVKNPTPLHGLYSSCSGVGFFYPTSLQVPSSCFFTFFHFNPTTFSFLMFFYLLVSILFS